MTQELRFDPAKVKKVPVGKVKPNTWNPKPERGEGWDKVRASIEQKGLRLPVVVRSVGRGSYEILDGEQRYTAAVDLGYTDVLVYDEGKVSDQEAQELTLWYQQQVPFDEVDLAALMASMVSEYGRDGLAVPFDDTELDELLALADFDWDAYGDRPGEGDDEQAMATLKVPMTRAQYEVVQQAMQAVRDSEGDPSMADARALELVAADYLAGVG